MILAPCMLRCPNTNPVDMIQLYEIEKHFLTAIIEHTPETLFNSCNPTLASVTTSEGIDTPYTENGFEQLSEEQIVHLKVQKQLVIVLRK